MTCRASGWICASELSKSGWKIVGGNARAGRAASRKFLVELRTLPLHVARRVLSHNLGRVETVNGWVGSTHLRHLAN
jgi:hypothetical protein